MAFLAVDENNNEFIFDKMPERDDCGLNIWVCRGFLFNFIQLPSGTIEKLIGKKMTWLDEPHELKSDK